MTKEEIKKRYGTQAQHIINHMEKIAGKDAKELECKGEICQVVLEDER